MAKFKDQIKKIDNKFKKIFRDLVSSSSMKVLGELGVERIRKRTQLGKGVSFDGGPESKLQDIADSTIKKRKKTKKKGKLSKNTSPKRSNLTETGQMLEKDFDITKLSRASVEIGFKTTRSKDIADIHNKRGAGKSKVKRPFFHLSAKDKKAIRTEIRKKLRSFVKK